MSGRGARPAAPPARRRERGGPDGFILLEVLVAMSLLTVGIVAVLLSIRNSLEVSDRSADLFRATLLLDEVLGEVRAGSPPEEVPTAPPGSGLRCDLAVVPWEDPDLLSLPFEPEPGSSPDAGIGGLRLVRATVTWGQRGRERSIEVVELVRARGPQAPEVVPADLPPDGGG